MVVQNNKNQITDEQLDISDMPKNYVLDMLDRLKACNKVRPFQYVPMYISDGKRPPLGVLWGGICSIDGEKAYETIRRQDEAYFLEIKAKLEEVNLTATQVMVKETNMPFLHDQIMDYLNNHPIRNYYFKQATIEYLSNPVEMVVSKEDFELHFMGKFEAAKKCKCGVDWTSKLYGDECVKCGDKRPVG